MPADLVWIVPAAIGALGLITVVGWRLSARWRFRRRLRSQTRRLASFEPTERVRGAVGVVELGLTRRTAGPLLEHVAGEEDEHVRLAIAQAVASHDGKRTRHRRVQKLLGWSAEERAEHGQGATPMPGRKQRKRRKKQQRISWRAPAPQS